MKDFSLEDMEDLEREPSILDRLLDEDDDENIVLFDMNNEAHEFEQIAVIPYDERIYAIMKPVLQMEGIADDEALVFALDEFEDECAISIETDDRIANEVFERYYELLDETKDEE